MSVNFEPALARCQLFTGLDASSLSELASIAVQCSYQKGAVIFRQGQSPPGVYVILVGEVRIFKLSASGKEHVLHLARQNQSFLEAAVLGGYECPANAEAVTDLVCLLLPGEKFKAQLDANHALCRQLLVGMSSWIRQLVSLLEDIVLRDAMGRVAQFLVDGGSSSGESVDMPALRKDLASHLNLTSETLSRTMRRLVQAGLINQSEGEITLLDEPSLRSAADGAFPRV